MVMIACSTPPAIICFLTGANNSFAACERQRPRGIALPDTGMGLSASVFGAEEVAKPEVLAFKVGGAWVSPRRLPMARPKVQ
ncbi:Uncharacterised protein [Mycobacteroides abscessus subsp. massiliense]|nr:Uncharacterised protein [Mycobacteroides abscessus subsp. massiliense]